jgi:hypothetical protein
MQVPQARVAEWRNVDLATFTSEILPACRPAVLKGLVKGWPLVNAAAASPERLMTYLANFYRGSACEVFVAASDIGGRFFYRDDLASFNFQKRTGDMLGVIKFLQTEGVKEHSPAVYMGAASVPQQLPGLDLQNPMPILAGKPTTPRIWVGNRTSISTHFDTSDNIACVVAGRRRFTIFPPEQVANLYVGPLDNTMAGQPSSMVSLHDPDFTRFPKFRDALAASLTAELEPGDAIYIPTLWWHQVDSLAPFNILMNYWWVEAPLDSGSPWEAMAHGLMTISHLPEARREAWRFFFDHYVFQKNGDPAEHIPPDRRGILSKSTAELRAKMRAFLQRSLTGR